jgi:hypothetical protein
MSLSFKFVPALALLAIAFSLVLTQHRYERDKARIEAASATAAAEVLKKRVEAAPGPAPSSAKDVTQCHLVSYRFTVPGEKPVEGTVELEAAAYDRVKEGDTIAVRYRQDEPSLHIIEDGGIIVSGSTVIARTEGSWPLVAAAALAALAVLWLSLAPRLARA